MSAALEYLDELGQFLAGLHARQCWGEHICLAAQPITPNGTPDAIVDDAVGEAARITGGWAEQLAEAVDGLGSEAAIVQAIAIVARRFDVESFAALTEREILRGVMLGSLDAEWEFQQGDTIPLARFAEQQEAAFAQLPFADAIRLWEERKVLPKAAFEALNEGAKRKAFTIARVASDELLTTAHAELLRMIRESPETTYKDPETGKWIHKGPNFREFKKFVRERLESAGWTPANASHIETIYRTNVVSAYSSGRVAHGLKPTMLAALPYWQIHTVRDDRQRKTHRAAHGVVLLKTDRFWLIAFPPFGLSCRCRAVARSKSWVERTGAKIGPAPTGLPDPGFDSGIKALIQAPPATLIEPPKPRPAQVQVPTQVPRSALPPFPGQGFKPPPAPVRMPAPAPVPIAPRGGWSAGDFTARGIRVDGVEEVNKSATDLFGRELSPDEYKELAAVDMLREANVAVSPQWSRSEHTMIRVSVSSPDGTIARRYVRDGETLVAKHQLFELEPGAQGKGIGRRVLRQQLQQYLRYGVGRIELDAAWVGQYTWLRMGFQLREELMSLDSLKKEFRAWMTRNGIAREVAKEVEAQIVSPRGLALAQLGGRKLGKEFLLERGQSEAGLIPLQLTVDPNDPYFRLVAEDVGL